MSRFLPSLATLCLAGTTAVFSQDAKPFPVNIRVDAAKPLGPLTPIWRYFGADEPNYAYMKDGKKLIAELGEMKPKGVYFRAHNMLTTGDGTPALKWGSTNAYTEDADGKPIYDWTITDRIFDTYLERGVRPYVQLGFMPQALSVHPDPYQHHWTPEAKYDTIYLGWAYPPKDYVKWSELCYQWTKHCVEKYGREEVETWWWELWNEPNIGYWHGTQEEFYKLYDYSVEGVRRALPTARIGGPEIAGGPGGGKLENFLKHCVSGTNAVTGKQGTPIDLLSFHAKGSPKFVDGHVRMGISSQLKDIDGAFSVIAKFPELKNKPIVIGESDPEGCAACQGPQNGYRNGTMYSSYTAASFARKYELADKHGVNLEGALTWAFEFEDQPYFAGFRVLASNGIDHPVLNVFRMMSKMSGDRLTTTSDAAIPLDDIVKNGVRQQADVSALASRDGKKVSVLVWHYHDDDVAGPDAAVTLTIPGLPASSGQAKVNQFRIDETHSNAFTMWKALGEPQKPTDSQYKELEQAGKLASLEPEKKVTLKDGTATVNFTLPRQGVSLLVIECE
ncbi:MAG: beta-xylosidase [Luteolibacter sp.]